MEDHGYILVFGFITALLVVLFTMPSLIKVARMKHLVDEPSEARKLHERSVPTIGGVIIFAAIIFSYALWFPMAEDVIVSETREYKWLYQALGSAYKDFKYILASMVLLFFIGVKDDIVGFSPAKKLVGHLVVGYLLVVVADIRIVSMHGIFDFYELPHSVSVAFSFFIYIVLVNSVNLIDGIDGLAGGVGLISSLALGTWLYLAGNVPLALLAAVLAGSLVGFLVFNFNPARIFMGDSGSLIIGAILAVLAMRVIDHPTHKLPLWLRDVPTPLFAMSAIAYPLVDTFRVFIYRMVKGNSPFTADKNHIHHRWMKLGRGHRGTVLILYSYSLAVVGCSLFTVDMHPTRSLLGLGSFAIVLALIPFMLKIKGTVGSN